MMSQQLSLLASFFWAIFWLFLPAALHTQLSLPDNLPQIRHAIQYNFLLGSGHSRILVLHSLLQLRLSNLDSFTGMYLYISDLNIIIDKFLFNYYIQVNNESLCQWF